MAPKSPTGEMLAYVRENSPHLFETSVEEQLRLLETAAESGPEAAEAGAGKDDETASTDITLYRCGLSLQRKEVHPVSGETPCTVLIPLAGATLALAAD